MTELTLYKFINDNNIEWHWNQRGLSDDVLIFPAFYQIEDFAKLFSPSDFDESGIECTMKDKYFCFWMRDICEAYGIEIENVFPKEK